MKAIDRVAVGLCVLLLFALILRAGYVAHQRMDELQARIAQAERQATAALSLAVVNSHWTNGTWAYTNAVVVQDAVGNWRVQWPTNGAPKPPAPRP